MLVLPLRQNYRGIEDLGIILGYRKPRLKSQISRQGNFNLQGNKQGNFLILTISCDNSQKALALTLGIMGGS